MYRVILKPLVPNRDYRFVPMKNKKGSFINIHISPADESLWLTILKSDDGLFFTDITQTYSELNIDTEQTLDDACNYITNYFIEMGYEIIDYKM